MKLILIFAGVLSFAASILSFAQENRITVSQDIYLFRITDNAYVHVSYSDMPPYGRVGSNGLIFVNNGKAFLFDTPVTESLTKTLVSWIQDTMGIKIVCFVPNHWHSDCMGGLAYVHSLGIESYANEVTIEIAKSKDLPVPGHGFRDARLVIPGHGQFGGTELLEHTKELAEDR